MLFRQDELLQLIPAIETYDDVPRNVLVPDVQHTLSVSCLNKLNNLSILTYFTKKEYSLMLLAVDHIIRELEHNRHFIDGTLYDLYDKLMIRAMPNTNNSD